LNARNNLKHSFAASNYHKILVPLVILAILAITIPIVQGELTCIAAFGSAGTGVGQFSVPSDLAIASNGNVFVTDYNNNHVDVFDSKGVALFKFGSIGANPGQFYQPSGIAADNSGSIYVTSAYYNIQAFNTAGQCTLQVGNRGTGNGQFYRPYGIAVDDAKIYVTDTQLFRVQVFDKEGHFQFTFGSKGYDDGQFQMPVAIDVDNTGRIYVLDASRCLVQVFDTTGAFLYKFGSQGSGDNQFYNPGGLAIDDAGNIYISNTGYARVHVFDASGNFLYKFGSYGTALGQFQRPYGLEVASNGDIYVPDGLLQRVQIFSSNAQVDTTAPQSTIALNPGAPNGNNGWYTTPVTVQIIAADNTDGTGVASITYTIDNSAPVTIAAATASFTINTEGTHTVSYYATDNSQNKETTRTSTMKIDFTVPTITATKTPSANAQGWNNGDVTVTFTVSDDVSGVVSVPANQVISTDGTGQYVIGTVVDVAGNAATLTVGDINIDKTAPTTIYNLIGDSDSDGWYTSNVQVALTASDALSGAKSTFFSEDGINWIPYHNPLTINREGTTTIYYYSTDNAGNVEPTQSFVVNIAYTVTFTQTGLPAGTQWCVIFDSTTQVSTANSITFKAKSGNYNYVICEAAASPNTRYIPTQTSGTLNVPTQQTLDATFKTQYFVKVQANPTESATITPISGWYDSGASITLSATPNNGYMFYSWTSNTPAITIVSDNTAQTTATINGAGTITATVPCIVDGTKHITLTGDNNVVIITGGNNKIDASKATATTIIKTGAGNNEVKLGEGNNVFISTADGNDKITTGNGDNTITVNADGNLIITTGNGNDKITITGKGNHQIDAKDGDNQITVSDGNNQITTGKGNDVIIAGNGNNQIKTGAGNDQITVGDGNNNIDGGAGIDTVFVGTGKNKITNCEN
jgi:hypothetical protein